MVWLFYIAKVHLNYNKEEFLDTTFKEIVDLWKIHKDFNGWEDKKQEAKKVFIEDIFF